MTEPSPELVEEIARVIHTWGVARFGVTQEWDRVVPKLQEQYLDEARAVLSSRLALHDELVEALSLCLAHLASVPEAPCGLTCMNAARAVLAKVKP